VLGVLLNLLILLFVGGGFATDQNFGEVLIDHFLEVVLAEDGDDEGGVDLGGVVFGNEVHDLVLHGSKLMRSYFFMENRVWYCRCGTSEEGTSSIMCILGQIYDLLMRRLRTNDRNRCP
jgi:hypothetical protein